MRALRVAIALLAISLGVGCASYSERIQTATAKVRVGDYPGAVGEIDAFLGVDPGELPNSWGKERPLAILERGALKQALGDFEGSKRDLTAGETELELLDYEDDTGGQIAKWVFSDSSGDYQTPPTERLALGAVNMLNYLALGDWQGASVEARRFTVNREFLESEGLDRQGIFGSYLAGLTFERLGEGGRALRYYEEAMAGGVFPTLREPVRRLAADWPYRAPKIRQLVGDGPLDRARLPSEIVTVISLGRVPYKVPERMPIGAAVGIAGTFITGNPQILARSVFKVVVYPDLKDSGSLARTASVSIDGRPAPVDRISSTGADIRMEYELLKPRIIGAALSRMIARAAAAEGARYAGRQAGGAGALIGLLAALGTEAALVAADTPDTRSWTLLADHVLISRQIVEPGPHRVAVSVSGGGLKRLRETSVEVPPGQAVVVVVTEPQ